MKFTLIMTVLACVTMMSLQATDMTSSRRQLERYEARRISMTNQYWHARRAGYWKMPPQICPPALSAGTFIANQAITCAMQFLMPGSGMVNKIAKITKKVVKTGIKMSKKLGKVLGKKMNILAKIKAKRDDAIEWVVGKLLYYLGCPAQKRRMSIFSDWYNGVYSAADRVAKFAAKVKAGVVDIGKKGYKALKKGAKFAAKIAKQTAKDVSAFTNKYGGIIKAVACPIVRKLCSPACMALSTAIQAQGSFINVTFHIPIGCLSDTIEAGCNKLCEVVCGRRRLMIKKL